MHARTHACTHARTHACMHCIHTQTHVYTHTHTNTHANMHTYTQTCTQTHTHIHTHTNTRTRAHTHMQAPTHIQRRRRRNSASGKKEKEDTVVDKQQGYLLGNPVSETRWVCSQTLNQLKVMSGAPSALHVNVAVCPFSLAAFEFSGDLSIIGASETRSTTVNASACASWKWVMVCNEFTIMHLPLELGTAL